MEAPESALIFVGAGGGTGLGERPQGLRVGAPLSEFRGVLTGTPEYLGSSTPLMEDRPGRA